ncbi:MAG: hypothetical protein ACREHG_06385 [Candidatus Saccharimonadales bacterium]
MSKEHKENYPHWMLAQLLTVAVVLLATLVFFTGLLVAGRHPSRGDGDNQTQRVSITVNCPGITGQTQMPIPITNGKG